MSAQYTPAQIQQQNSQFATALANHSINQTQYDAAMKTQNANLNAYYNLHPSERPLPVEQWTNRTSTPVQSTPQPSAPVSPMPTEYWSQPTKPSTPSQPQTVNVVQGGTTWQTTITPPAPPTQSSDAFGLIGAVLQNPLGALGVASNVAQASGDVLAKSDDTLTKGTGVYLQATSGSMGELANQGTGIKNLVNNVVGQPQLPTPYTPTSDAAKAGQIGMIATELVASTIATAGMAPAGAGAVGIAKAIASGPVLGAGLNVGIGEAARYAETGQFGTPVQIGEEAVSGAAFANVGQGIIKAGVTVAGATNVGTKIITIGADTIGKTGVGQEIVLGAAKVADDYMPVASKVATIAVGTTAGRTATFAALGGGIGYATNPTPQGAIEGAIMGGAFSLGGELAGKTLLPKINQLRGIEMLSEGPKAVSIGGNEVATYVSKPNEGLGGRQLRVIQSITVDPINPKLGVTRESMIGDYVGKTVPTSHATLEGGAFNTKVGGETLLKGFPEKAQSGRTLHFYSAPGSDQYVTTYGGYMGIGDNVSGSIPQIKTGRATILSTLETRVDPTLIRQPTESPEQFIARFGQASGKTGVGIETQLGVGTGAMERQLVTPSSYLENGKQLPGSLYVSEGKVGTFQIRQYSESSIFGKPVKDIPVIRDLTSKVTTFDVVKGRYEAVTTKPTETISTTEVNTRPTRIVSDSVVSVPSSAMVQPIGASSYQQPSVSSISSVPSNPSSSMPTFISSEPSISSQPSFSSQPYSSPSKPSVEFSNTFISEPSKQKPSDYPSISDTSIPYELSTSSTPSLPSVGDTPSYPSRNPSPSVPSIPSIGSTPIYPSKDPSPSPSPYPSPYVPKIGSVPQYPSPSFIPHSSSMPQFSLPSSGSSGMGGNALGFHSRSGKFGVKKEYPILSGLEFVGVGGRTANRKTKRKQGNPFW